MKHDRLMFSPALLTACLGTMIAIPAHAADADTTRNAPAARQPSPASAPGFAVNPATQPPAVVPAIGAPAARGAARASPGNTLNSPTPLPALAPPPTEPAPAPAAKQLAPLPELVGKPDYAIGLLSQLEQANLAEAWQFRIENRGAGAPGSTTVKGGGLFGQASEKSATLAISVGSPCPGGTSKWAHEKSFNLPPLKPGESVVVPVQMPDGYAGKGCRFKAEIVGPDNDKDLSNNAMQMSTKLAKLPDLVVEMAADQGGPGGGLEVVNMGDAPAKASVFRFRCISVDKSASCAKPGEDYEDNLTLDVPVPALNPKQSFVVKKSTPGGGYKKGVSWKAQADFTNTVAESNEGNNTKVSQGSNVIP